ncbi:copper resistance protein NlpE N-terminal domain-containing protein [Cobetia marina]|uniref:Copper resistance protein NlpE N-terminal domain-containing protein n=1 Tax=Cobetia marina TaxID=28258 RepID=A0ABU9GD10_COBMA|nr:copper resistance protein NlpE N-terminal domain-containing protein [Cobetia pacifica]MDI6005286.1 copper resistance protein NlpE N-terminal domain-containing protein [Cobetia pacifica]
MSRTGVEPSLRGESFHLPSFRIAGLLMAGLLSLLAGCSSTPEQGPTDYVPPPIERFVGTLPCQDCRLIRADLTLHRDPESGEPTAFFLQEAHVDAVGGDFVTTQWGDFEAETSDSTTYLHLERDTPLNLKMQEGGDTLKLMGQKGADSDYEFTRAEPLG